MMPGHCLQLLPFILQQTVCKNRRVVSWR